jgi:PhnB protein
MNSSIISLIPYLSFEGTCEEALHAYSEIFGGKVDIQSRYDNPAMKAPKEYHNKVLHASMQLGEFTIMASDVFPGTPSKNGNANIALAFAVKTPEDGKKLFELLSKGGNVNVPFEKQFWGEWHGNLTDRFGIRWMVSCNN